MRASSVEADAMKLFKFISIHFGRVQTAGILLGTLAAVGCGPNLTGTFSGSHTRLGSVNQSYRTEMNLFHSGNEVTGSVTSTPSFGATGFSNFGTVPFSPFGSFNNFNNLGFGGMTISGTLQGTVERDVVRNVRLTMNENGCQYVYTGQFTIRNGSRLEGSLNGSNSGSTAGTSDDTSNCVDQSSGFSTSARFDVVR